MPNSNDIKKFPPESDLDLPNQQEFVPMEDAVTTAHLQKSWTQEVEEESLAQSRAQESAGCVTVLTETRTITIPQGAYTMLEVEPWPPLSREQVVELHEALVAWGRASMRCKRECGNWDDGYFADEHLRLSRLLEHLNIGTPQPPPHQEENLGGFACLDERRMAPPLDADVQTMRGTLAELEEIQRQRDAHQRQRRAQAMEPETSDRLERIRSRLNAKPTVKRNCWTCRHNHPPRNNCDINGRLDVAMWVGSVKGWTRTGMPPQDADNCPGWTEES